MADDFTLPDLGEGIEEAEVIGVLVHVGDTVEADQPLIEVETEKANLDVPSPHAGVVEAVLVAVGEVIRVGQPIVSITPANGASAVSGRPRSRGPLDRPERRQRRATTGARFPRWSPLAPSRSRLPLRQLQYRTPVAAPALAPEGRSVAASPAVRLFAREIGVRIGDVSGSGPGGRVALEDVKAHARALLSALYASPSTAAPPAPVAAPIAPPPAPTSEAGVPPLAVLPDLAQFGEVERERMSPTRRATARNLAQSWAQSPHITLQQKADVTALDALRRERRDRVAEAGGSLTMLPILMQVVARALAEFPRLNASIDMATQEIVYRRYIHVGVATDTERGLVVPVVRDADQKSLTELAVEIRALAERARDRKLSIDDMRGGTFTISNLGGMGTGFFTAILHPPQVGILAVGRAEMEPVWVDGGFQPRLRMPLGLTVDHRLIDGADAARALSWIVDAIEEPPELVV